MPSAWNKLPCEILLSIFDHVDRLNNDDKLTRTILYNCQLVCKSWSKLAQSELYKNVYYDYGRRGSCKFRQFLLTIASSSSNVGIFVTKITLCRHSLSTGDPVEDVLKLLFQYCPNIEELYTFVGIIDVVWSYLISQEISRLPRLKLVLADAQWVPCALCSSLAKKFKGSLVAVHLHMGAPLAVSHGSAWTSNTLVKILPEFSSLKALNFDSCRISYDHLNEIVDLCRQTVERISFWEPLRLCGSMVDTSTMKLNYSVKKIKIDAGVSGDSWLFYLENKFKRLETLSINSMDTSIEKSQEELEKLCTRVKNYYLGFRCTITEESIRQCIKITKATKTIDKQLLIRCGAQGMLTLDRRGNTSRLEMHVPNVDDAYNYCAQCLEKRFFTAVEVKEISTIVASYEEYEFDYFEEHNHLETTESSAISFSNIFKKYTATERSNDKSWSMFNKLISYAVNMANVELLLDSLIITDLVQETLPQQKSPSSTIKHLTITNSIFCHQAFPLISKAIPSVDTLSLDACYITMDQPYTLKLFLPFTKLRRLRLIVKPLLFSYHLPENARLGRQQLRNTDLLEAMSPERQYSLRIEANGQVYSYNVKNKKTRLRIENQDHLGTSDNFLVWMKCSKLEELYIVDGTHEEREPSMSLIF